jgi:hypothetical protein
MENIPLRKGKGFRLAMTKAIFWIEWLRAELAAGEWAYLDDLVPRARKEVGVSTDRAPASRYAAKQSLGSPAAASEASLLEASLPSVLSLAATQLRSREEEEAGVHEMLETR